MALTANDFSIVLTLVVKSVTCKNVFWYKTSDECVAGELNAMFLSDVLPDILAVLSSEVTATTLYTYSLTDVENFETIGITGGVGLRGSDVMPIFNGWYFLYHRTSRLVNNGRKTFAGIAEVDVSDGVALATPLGLLEDLGVTLGSVQNIPIGKTAIPCIAKTVEYTNPETDKTYRIPETLIPVNTVTYERISTQNSRKR